MHQLRRAVLIHRLALTAGLSAVALLPAAVSPGYAGAATERVSVSSAGMEGNGNSGVGRPAASADGRFVAFVSRASNLVPGDTNARQDVFVRDRRTDQTERVSVDSAGGQASDAWWDNEDVAISADGRFVAFTSSPPTSRPATRPPSAPSKLTLHADGCDWSLLPAAGGTFPDAGAGSCH